MDSATERESDYGSLLKEDWVKLGYQPRQDPLTNDIHPLFHRTNALRPSGFEHIWPQFKDEERYGKMLAVMDPILRLASNVLETPKSLDFLYQVAFSTRTYSRGEQNNRGRPCKEFGWTEPPDEGIRRATTKEALLRLSRSLTILIGGSESNPDLPDLPDLGESLAYTGPKIQGFADGVKISEVSRNSGSASGIVLNNKYTSRLVDLYVQGVFATPQIMSLQLRLAIALCHEISHALAFAVDGELLRKIQGLPKPAVQAQTEGIRYQSTWVESAKPFYRDERIAEIGNSWENQVFGGRILWAGDVSEPLFVSKWPSFLNKEEGCLRRRGEKLTARKYLVSMHFIQNVHRQGFWDNVVRNDTTALFIKKTVGLIEANPDEEADTLSIDSSEIDWPREDDSNRVDREIGGQQPRPDPSGSHANETEHERVQRELASGSRA